MPELFEGGFEVFDDFWSDYIRIREVVGFFEAFVSQPEMSRLGLFAVAPDTRLYSPVFPLPTIKIVL